jgi:competence protein ComEC
MPASRRWFWASLGAWLGTAVQLQQAALVEAGWAWGAAVCAVLGMGVALRCPKAPSDLSGDRYHCHSGLAIGLCALLCLSGALLGWSVTELRAAARLAERLDPALEGQDLEIDGQVAAMPLLRPEGIRFRFDVEAARFRGRAVALGQACPRQLSLGWYRQPQEADEAASASTWPRAGERWRLTVRLRRPHGPLNPAGFDQELWMFEQGLRATGHVRDRAGRPPMRLAEAQGTWIEVARERWRAALYRQVGQDPAAGVLAALSVGDQAAIEAADWTVFRRTGVAHLVSISGLHVTLFAWLAGRVLGWLWRRSKAACLLWPAPAVTRWGGLLCALVYALMAGWGVPAQRTVMMLAAVTVLRSLGLNWSGLGLLWVAGSVVLAWDPWALLQPGFWLSFVAVALLMGSEGVMSPAGPAQRSAAGIAPLGGLARWTRWRLALRSALASGWRSQWVVSFGLAPWTLLFFQQLSLVGLLANAVAIPVVTLWITPLALLGLVVPPVWSLASWSVSVLMALLRPLADWPWAVWQAALAPVWMQLAGLIGAVLAVAPMPWRVRLLGASLMVPMLGYTPPAPAPGEFELLAVDVGQGTAVLVRTHGHTLLYDAGPTYGGGRDAGDRLVVPLLRAFGVQRLDVLALSHRDSDHVGGAESVIRQVGARTVLSTLETGHPLRTASVHQACAAGLSWEWDGVRFEWLHPPIAALGGVVRARHSNALSCVLRLQGRGRAALLTGDVEREQELTLVEQHQARLLSLQADVLVVPHHGSRTSSTDAFLAAVAPAEAVMQVGWRNRYGHPAPEVLARYHALGIHLRRTDHCGAWGWQSVDASSWCERERRARYWHAPAWGEGFGDGPEIAN